MKLEDMIATVFDTQLKSNRNSYLVRNTIDYLNGERSATSVAPRYKSAVINAEFGQKIAKSEKLYKFCYVGKFVPVFAAVASVVFSLPIDHMLYLIPGFVGFAIGEYANSKVIKQNVKYKARYEKIDPERFAVFIDRAKPQLEKVMKKYLNE